MPISAMIGVPDYCDLGYDLTCDTARLVGLPHDGRQIAARRTGMR